MTHARDPRTFQIRAHIVHCLTVFAAARRTVACIISAIVDFRAWLRHGSFRELEQEEIDASVPEGGLTQAQTAAVIVEVNRMHAEAEKKER